MALAALVALPIGCASAPMPPPEPVRVRIVSAGEPVRVRLTPDGASALPSHIRRCTTPCDRPLWTGVYKLHVDGSGVTALNAQMRIRDPSWVVVRPGSEALHYSGLFIATLSMIVAPVSAYLGVFCTESHYECRPYLYAFLGAALGIPAGWIMYSAGKTTFEVMPAWAPAPPTPLHTVVRERAGSVAMDRGGLGWTWRF